MGVWGLDPAARARVLVASLESEAGEWPRWLFPLGPQRAVEQTHSPRWASRIGASRFWAGAPEALSSPAPHTIQGVKGSGACVLAWAYWKCICAASPEDRAWRRLLLGLDRSQAKYSMPGWDGLFPLSQPELRWERRAYWQKVLGEWGGHLNLGKDRNLLKT